MTLRNKQEAYAQLVAKGSLTSESEKLQAMSEAGYKATNATNAKRQLKNLEKNQDVINRINELQAIRILEDGEHRSSDSEEAKQIVSALSFFETVYDDENQPIKSRMDCAESALPYEFAAHGEDSKALKMIQGVYQDPTQSMKNRFRSARVAVTFEEGEQKLGKKDQAKKDATVMSSNGLFATMDSQMDMLSASTVQ